MTKKYTKNHRAAAAAAAASISAAAAAVDEIQLISSNTFEHRENEEQGNSLVRIPVPVAMWVKQFTITFDEFLV